MRLTNAIDKKGYTADTTSPVINIEDGNFEGYLPELAKVVNGQNYESWINGAAYLSRQIIPVVIRTPKAFDILAEKDLGDRLKKIWINMVTTAPLTITGFNRTLTAETTEHRIGAAGEMFDEFTKVTRARTVVTTTYNERMAKPYNKFLDFIIRYLILDPDTQSPLITTLQLVDGALDKGELYTNDYFTGTIMGIEADVINKNVVETYIVANFAPKSAGESTARRDLGGSAEMAEYSIEWTGITTSGESARVYGQTTLDRMTIFKTSPDTAPLFINATEARVANEKSDTGFNKAPIEMADPLAVNADNTFNS